MRYTGHNMGLAKMRAAVLYLPCGVLCTCRVLRHDSALNPALRQALKRYKLPYDDRANTNFRADN